VFSDEQVRKMHDSLSMRLVRFEILLKPYESREFAWVTYFLPWVLINEAMLHKNVEVCDRMAWFLNAYCYLMTCLETYQSCELGTEISPFGEKKGPSTTRRTLFDQKLLIHATNSISGILGEIRNTPQGTKISLQRLSTVPLENSFSVTRMHAGRNHTLAAIIKAMEVDADMKFVYPHVHVKNRRLAYGEIIDACHDLPDIEISLFVFAQSVFSVFGFSAHMTFVVDHLVSLARVRCII
jgi:hypothetical protein